MGLLCEFLFVRSCTRLAIRLDNYDMLCGGHWIHYLQKDGFEDLSSIL